MPRIFKIAALIILVFSMSASTLRAQTVTVNWTDTHQTIDGFGAAGMFLGGNPLLTSNIDLFFSPSKGIGLSLLRLEVPDDGSCATVNVTCAGDVTTMNLAIARGARVWSTPLSPPASMKSNASTTCTGGSGSGALLSGSYSAYAAYLANYVKSVTAQGISLYALSVQNEPEICPTYDGALWTPANYHDFLLNNLGPAFAAAGLTGVKLMLPETSQSAHLSSYTDPTMNDSTDAGFVGLVATHDYGVATAVPYTTGGKNLWETEVSDLSPFDPSITSGLVYAQEIHNWMTVANANAWHFWWLVGLNGDNEGLIDNASGVVSKRLYVIGNYSKFVRPGWVRIGATAPSQNGIYVSAYKNPSTGDFAIVAINQNGSDSPVTIGLSGFGANSVAPWTTSASLNLQQQSTVTVTAGSINVTLPASSVTTFVGNGAAKTGPAAPVITGAVAH
jgi:glucuronoarabinoxylan endo-1,4-beta-xylanase